MKTQMLLQKSGLTILIVLLTALITHAQIPIKGLHADHEGIAAWDADGSGPEPAAEGHLHPFGWTNTPYYSASVDYDGILPEPDAALAHIEGEIIGFPLFEQALADQGFLPDQVKIKIGLMSLESDLEGEDWFTISSCHHFNSYNGTYILELDGETMIGGFANFAFLTYEQSVYNHWHMETNFGRLYDASENSSAPVQAVAAAFLADLNGMELRVIYEKMQSTGIAFDGNGRDGVFFEIVSGYIEKGLPQFPYTGLASNHEGIACWNADGTGPEPEKTGHSITYNGTTYDYSYYYASRDYDDIDNDPDAALCRFVDGAIGFPNTIVQLAYRGFTLDQFKVKSGISTFGNDHENYDWGLNGSVHWWHTYGTQAKIEIADEPIFEYAVDTNFSSEDLANPWTNWESETTAFVLVDVSSGASADARQVAKSFLKDLCGHTFSSNMEGHFANEYFQGNGRDGVFQEITTGKLTARQPEGTHIWGGEVSGTWTLANSPYIIMDEIVIADGQVLTIEPGVEVKFVTTKAFYVGGCIIAEGTEESPVLFTAYDESIPWGGIGIPNNDTTNNEPILLRHCIFEYAYAYNPDNLYGYNCGGAIRVDDYEQIEISHCTFRYNGADNHNSNNPCGGAIMINECSIHISHCIFHDNYSAWGGALAILDNSTPTIDDCLFYNNLSNFGLGGGGAVLVWTECDPHFINCTFVDNHAVEAGGAVELEFGDKTVFTNCIFWGNTADDGASQISVWDPDVSMLHVYYSDVQYDTLGITPGFQGAYVGNIDLDPEFITVHDFPFVPDTTNSPCVNEGTTNLDYLPENYAFPEYCLGGNVRIFSGEVDMGCYESPVLFPYIYEEENLENEFINIYPNPINANPVIEFCLDRTATVTFSLLDIHGKQVSNQIVKDCIKGKNRITCDAGHLAPGVYFCNLKVGNESFFEKIIKL